MEAGTMEDATMEVASETPVRSDGGARPLDPFGFFRGMTSRIGGLGGASPAVIEGYAFHTPYVDPGAGSFVFVVDFTGLRATSGNLSFMVHAIAPRAGALAHPIEIQIWDLATLAKDGQGTVFVPCEALQGLTYGLFGQISGVTDAFADGLSIALWRRSDLERETEREITGRRTQFQATDIKAVAHLVSGNGATLGNPVSQAFTADQLDEPVHAYWLDRLGLAGSMAEAHWGQTFVLQALQRYGLLEPDARGLGFEDDSSALPAVMAVIGCTVIATGRADLRLDTLRRPAICPDSVLDAQVSCVAASATDVPDDFAGFDFLWSLGIDATLGSPAAVERFVERTLRCLKPGGGAVHVFNRQQADDPATEDRLPAMSRIDIDRLALSMISHGHEVAQLNYGSAQAEAKSSGGRGVGTVAAPGMFGFIIRRSLKA